MKNTESFAFTAAVLSQLDSEDLCEAFGLDNDSSVEWDSSADDADGAFCFSTAAQISADIAAEGDVWAPSISSNDTVVSRVRSSIA
jgi:hypothetical protein